MRPEQQHWEMLFLAGVETSFTRDGFPYCLMNDLNLHLQKTLPGV